MKKTRTYPAVIGMIALLTAVGVANAQETKVTVGTLTCLLGAGKIDEQWEPRSLSCTFVSLDGVDVEYVGTIRNLGDPAPSADRSVLVWTVLSSSKETPGDMLVGEYAGEVESSIGTDKKPQGSLIGGENSSIELQPLTPVPGIKPGGTIVDIELKLEKTHV